MTQVRFEQKPDDVPFATTGLEAPSIFADHIRGMYYGQGVVKLNLIENRVDVTDSSLKSVHVATVIIPLEQLGPWGEFMTKNAQMLQEQVRADAVTAAAEASDGEV